MYMIGYVKPPIQITLSFIQIGFTKLSKSNIVNFKSPSTLLNSSSFEMLTLVLPSFSPFFPKSTAWSFAHKRIIQLHWAPTSFNIIFPFQTHWDGGGLKGHWRHVYKMTDKRAMQTQTLTAHGFPNGFLSHIIHLCRVSGFNRYFYNVLHTSRLTVRNKKMECCTFKNSYKQI